MMVTDMYMHEALKIFGTRPAIVRTLEGARHRSAVYQWSEKRLVPLGAAVILARKAGRELNMELYERDRQRRLKQLAKARQIRHHPR
jgi:hypothetical protein